MPRPIPEMTENVNDLVDRVRALLASFEAAGEVLIRVDVLTMPNVLTLHIPLPKG